jgi:hypothetical protein
MTRAMELNRLSETVLAEWERDTAALPFPTQFYEYEKCVHFSGLIMIIFSYASRPLPCEKSGWTVAL